MQARQNCVAEETFMRFALKKLTRSDLTFFEYQFRRQNAGNQKSINLNRNVFVDLIFPTAGQVAGGLVRQFPVPVTLYGPGMRSQPHAITRKVIAAGGSQKNWRLKGEFVMDPDFDPTRYHGLVADDFVVFGFDGANGLDRTLHGASVTVGTGRCAASSEVLAIVGGRSMAEVTTAQLQAIVQVSPANHPIRELLETERDEALQEAALGSAAGADKLLRNPSTRRMSAEALARARLAAEEAGRDGEVLVDIWLRREVGEGRLADAVWVSERNAVNPWDFEITELSGTVVRIEVKSTTGPFERDLHISQSEVYSRLRTVQPGLNFGECFGFQTTVAGFRSIAISVSSPKASRGRLHLCQQVSSLTGTPFTAGNGNVDRCSAAYLR